MNDVKRFFSGKIFLLLSFLAGVPIVIFDLGVTGIVVFVTLITLSLFLSENPVSALAPCLTACAIVFRWFLVSSKFIPYIPLLAIPVAAMILRCVIAKIPFRPGGTFLGLIFVTAAVLLGGLGSITKEEYFSPWNLYYLTALGFGMVLFYILCKKMIPADRYEESKKLFIGILYGVSLFCCFLIIHIFIVNLQEVLYTGRIPAELEDNPLRNLVSTMLVITMPSVFYFARKNNWHILAALLIVGCCFLTGSRGGLMLGGIQFFLGMLYLLVIKKDCRAINLAIVFVLIMFCLFNIERFMSFYAHRISDGMVKKDEKRTLLILRGIEDFRNAPFFGKGIGYTGNYDLYTPKPFEMSWYHNAPVQVMASMGILGIAAYVYQLVTRVTVLFRKIDRTMPIFTLCFIGVCLVSLIEPAEFSPIPFGMLTLFMFLLLDTPAEDKKEKTGFFKHPEKKGTAHNEYEKQQTD